MERTFTQAGNQLLDLLAQQIQQIPAEPGEQTAWVSNLLSVVRASLAQIEDERAIQQAELARLKTELEHSQAASQVILAEEDRRLAYIELQSRLIQERETERIRIARELHDGPLQELIATNFTLVEAMDINDREPRVAKLRQVQELLVKQVQELRRFCNELRPPALGPFGLEKTIRSHVDTLRLRYPDIRFLLELDKDANTLPEDLRLTLYRIYQELVNNVLRHSGAGRVAIRFHLHAANITLEVDDNGAGFQPPKDWLELARQGHLGLVGLQERIDMLGGKLEIDARPGRGTRVRVTTPR